MRNHVVVCDGIFKGVGVFMSQSKSQKCAKCKGGEPLLRV